MASSHAVQLMLQSGFIPDCIWQNDLGLCLPLEDVRGGSRFRNSSVKIMMSKTGEKGGCLKMEIDLGFVSLLFISLADH